MKYLTGVTNPTIEAYAATEPDLGLMTQPGNSVYKRAHLYSGGVGYDNGAFGAFIQGQPFDVETWRRGLKRLDPSKVLFAVVPDAVGDHDATLALWRVHAQTILDAGQPPAFVLQNGCTDFSQVPADARAVFIGGDTDYKLSATTAGVCWDAHAAGLWVHMGRANSSKRFLRAWAMGCDSADGTFMRFGPADVMVDRVKTWFALGRSRGSQLSFLDGPGVSA